MKIRWLELVENYCSDPHTSERSFDKLFLAYNGLNRYYHNLSHIRSMINDISSFSFEKTDKDTLLFATWYHDVVYDPRRKDNESESSILAQRGLQLLGLQNEMIQRVSALIMSTANHMAVVKGDLVTDYFLDCDLKILGAAEKEYFLYAESIRKEYKHVFSFIYRRERKKILFRFLQSPFIYRTSFFRETLEQQARKNLQKEIQIL